MGLLTPGYFPDTYWAKNYWTDNYWADCEGGGATPFPIYISAAHSTEYTISISYSGGGS